MKEEWFLNELNPNKEYSLSTWIYNIIKNKMKCFE
jgi:hypothetical protein